ncbi:phage virion morphogenesis protein [Denitromonas halophila]|uniref:Phage virion morphogenesis protein n=1 Tax=Denitromonas halophila TaxID=1629404 RepID=A0A557QXA1_9RHOO|nr:phage virion morphogenesis protein [Denitromonas halophila]TVO57537.1 hypothetical protein FHP91_07625 [Denitromonas halophila]
MPVTIEINEGRVFDTLAELAQALRGPQPYLVEIGEMLVDTTKQRFADSAGPDGVRWVMNSRATIEAHLGRYRNTTRKDGRINARGAAVVQGKRPLIGIVGALSTQIYYDVDGDSLRVGSPMAYAAMQHFGGRKSEFGHLWGDIPARPFLGISDSDEREIGDIVSRYLSRTFG